MRTRCCTTCRIFNWDHLMMFSPMIFMGGFYAVSLICLAFLAWLVWEVCIMLYPERFWDKSNAATSCAPSIVRSCANKTDARRKAGVLICEQSVNAGNFFAENNTICRILLWKESFSCILISKCYNEPCRCKTKKHSKGK